MCKYLKGCVLESHRIGLNIASSITIDMYKLKEILNIKNLLHVSFSTNLIIFPIDITENRIAQL